MKAMVCNKYGSPEVLQLTEVEIPKPRDYEVLVKVHAAAINSADLDLLRGKFFSRIGGPLKPFYKILGSDVAGKVIAVGSKSTLFKPGDEVFGDMTEFGFGTFAEYICVSEKALTLKSIHMTFEEAAAIPSAAVIALQGIRGIRQIEPGQKVLINGAGGGMGTFAVQMAKSFGAEVTGVDSREKLEIVRAIGADHVIDYKKEDFTKNRLCYDLILDYQAHHSVFSYRRILNPTGIYLMIGGSFTSILQAAFIGPLISKNGGKKIGLQLGKPNRQDDLIYIKELFEARKIAPVIDRVYPLNEVADAIRCFEEGHFKGKIVISM